MKKFSLRLMLLGLCVQGGFVFTAYAGEVGEFRFPRLGEGLGPISEGLRSVQSHFENIEVNPAALQQLKGAVDKALSDKILVAELVPLAQELSKFLADPQRYENIIAGISADTALDDKFNAVAYKLDKAIMKKYPSIDNPEGIARYEIEHELARRAEALQGAQASTGAQTLNRNLPALTPAELSRLKDIAGTRVRTLMADRVLWPRIIDAAKARNADANAILKYAQGVR